MIKKMKIYATILLAAVATAVMLFHGCGQTNSAVPNGSTITVTPSSSTITNSGTDIIVNYIATATYSNGVPIPDAQLFISGGLAYSSTGPGSVAPSYEFWNAWNPETGSGQRVNNGFYESTNSSGAAEFSILIYSSVTGTTALNAFTDTITVISGNAVGTTTLTVSAATTGS